MSLFPAAIRQRGVRLGLVAVLALATGARASGDSAANGLNLPPMQGSSNAGAFLAGVYALEYPDSFWKGVKEERFDSLRIPVNADTAEHAASLDTIERYFARVGDRGILCFFDTTREGEGSHGDGKPNDLGRVARAWAALHARFRDKTGIKYELFNEPFGYPKTLAGARQYVNDMKKVIEAAGLPVDRCILDGLGYADDVKLVSRAGWEGDLAYHFYPNWVPDGRRTQESYSNRIQADLEGVSHRVHVTEFGADLGLGDVYETYTPDGSAAAQDRNALRGFHDAVIAFERAGRGVRSTYVWHGWPNGDGYDLWDPKNRFGAAKVHAIQRDD